MNTGKQLSWVMVRTIGLLLAAYSLAHLPAALASGVAAYNLRHYTHITIRSDEPIADYEKDTPENRQLITLRGQLQFRAIVSAVLFLVCLSAGVYCLKGGKALQRLLMPPEEEEK